jgi:hypothetical protein
MNGTRKSLWVLAVASGVLVAGCSKEEGPDEQPPVGVSNEEQSMSYFAANDEFVLNGEETFSDQALEPLDYGTFGKVAAEVTPLRFGRFVTNVSTSVTTQIQPGDTVAVANVQKEITGILRVRAIDGSGDTVLIEKPFTDHSERTIIFARVHRNPARYWLNWVPVATSLVKGGTIAPNNNIEITQLRVDYANGDSLVVTDPVNYLLRYRWLKLWHGGRRDVAELAPGQQVRLQVTLTSTSADTDFVVLRYGFAGFNRKRVRLDLVSEVESGGTYTRVFETSRFAPIHIHFHRGFFHLGVDAMSRATLFDDAAPYSVSWWGVPYRVF